MRKTPKTPILIWASTAIALLLVVSMSLGNIHSVTAQDTETPFPHTYTPLPSPTGNGGSGTWTVKTMTFQSNYPKGANFTLDITSSAGKITSADVVWRHSPNSRNRRGAKLDTSSNLWKTGWTVGDNAVPQWSGVEYWWEVLDSAGNRYESEHKYDEYADNTRKWTRLESDDIILFIQEGVPEDAGPQTLAAMEQGRVLYTKWWGHLLNYKPRAIIYADYVPFEEWQPAIGTVVNGIITVGTTRQEWGGTAQVFLPQYGSTLLASVVRHEVGHLYQFYSGAATAVDWFIEGDAVYQELPSEIDRSIAHAKRIAASGNLPTLQDSGPSIRGGSLDGYDVGCAFFVWLEETYGPDVHLKLWTLLAKGKTRREALKTVSGKDYTAMEIDFRTWLGAPNPIPPTVLPTLTYIFPPTPTYPPTRAKPPASPTGVATPAATQAAQ